MFKDRPGTPQCFWQKARGTTGSQAHLHAADTETIKTTGHKPGRLTVKRRRYVCLRWTEEGSSLWVCEGQESKECVTVSEWVTVR
jgi:hypothetical protein